MSILKRRKPYRPPVYANPQYPAKQPTRDSLARAIAEHCGSAPVVFVMPGYEALCAKTIDKLVPGTVFHGADYSHTVCEKVASVRPDKRIVMAQMSVHRYVEDHAGTLKFDAAFLDFTHAFTVMRGDIRMFAGQMMKPACIFAVTAQRGSVDVVSLLTADLSEIAASVTLLSSLEYTTSHRMINAIFRLTDGDQRS